MQQPHIRPNKLMIVLYLAAIGVGIGWLIGLSVSPVVSIVITSITGSAAAIIAILSGVEDKDDKSQETAKEHPVRLRWAIDPLPLAVLVVGILVGSAIGVWARNHSWLGSPVESEIAQWRRAGLTDAGWTQQDIVSKLFESRYVTTGAITNAVAASAPNTNSPFGTMLFAIDRAECQRLVGASQMANQMADEAILKDALASSTISQLWQLPVVITETATLQFIVEQVLCADG
jgi:hypothetical protein